MGHEHFRAGLTLWSRSGGCWDGWDPGKPPSSACSSAKPQSRISGKPSLLSEPLSIPLEVGKRPWLGHELPFKGNLMTKEQGTKAQECGRDTAMVQGAS